EASTSMSCVSRTLIAVPDGTVTVGGGAGAGAGAAACGAGAGFGAGGGGLGAGLRAENSTDSASSIGISDTCPLSSSTRTVLLSAPMNMPSTTLPERSFTRSAETVAPSASASSAVMTGVCRRIIGGPPSLRGNRQRRRNLQIDQQLELVLDLQEAQRGLRLQRRPHPVVVLRLDRLAAGFPIGGAPCERFGRVVGQGVVVAGVLGDERDALVAQLRELAVVLAVDRPERGVLFFREFHHFGEDRDLLGADVAAQQLRVRREVQRLGLRSCRGRRLRGRLRRLGLRGFGLRGLRLRDGGPRARHRQYERRGEVPGHGAYFF